MEPRKAFLLIITGLLFFGYTNEAKAQSSAKLSYSIDAGMGIPAAPNSFTQHWNVGYGIGAGMSYEVQPDIKLQLYGQYYRFGLDKKGVKNNPNTPQSIMAVDGAAAETFHIMLNLVYEYSLPQASVTPYFSLGSGFLKADREDITVTTNNKPSKIDQKSGSTIGSMAPLDYGIRLMMLSHSTLKPSL